MRLEPFYRLRFTYPEEWRVAVEGAHGTDEQYFFIA